MILYLIRHGKSVANTLGLMNGTQEDVLSEEGIKQAHEMGAWLTSSGITADRYVTSTWKRAQQTAQIIRPDVAWTIEARVGETNAGDVSGWLCEKFISTHAAFYESTANRYPGGESHDELNARVVDWLVETARNAAEDEKVMLVGHAGSITCALQYVAGMGMERFPAFLASNASLSVAQIPPPGSKAFPRLLAFSLCPQDALSRSYIFNGVKWP